MDEFEIEVSDLRASAPSGRPPAGGDEGDGEREPKRGSPRMPPSRRRLIGGVVALAAVGLALLVALGQVAGNGLPGRSAAPDASRALARLVVVADTVPWGKLAIDGRSAPHDFAYLRPGRHAITYLAPPFPPLHCAVSLPHVAADTCHLLPPTTPDETGAALVLDMQSTPDRLLPAQQHALEVAIQSILDGDTSAATLAPGEHYAAPDGIVTVARQPLAVSLSFTLNLDPRRPDPFNSPPGGCATLCAPSPDRLQAQAQASATWQVLAHVLVRWSYTPTAGGETFVGGVSPANAQDVAVEADTLWQDGGWQVQIAQPPPEIVCELASSQLENVALPLGGGYSIDPTAANPADGCVLILTGSGGPVSELRVFYRCGVLLAADAITQHYVAALPAASAAEQALAARIAG